MEYLLLEKYRLIKNNFLFSNRDNIAQSYSTFFLTLPESSPI